MKTNSSRSRAAKKLIYLFHLLNCSFHYFSHTPNPSIIYIENDVDYILLLVKNFIEMFDQFYLRHSYLPIKTLPAITYITS